MKPVSPNGENARRALLGGLAALVVANVLLPADAVTAAWGAGLPLVGLALLLATVWASIGALRSQLTLRCGPAEWAVVALVAWTALAALLAARMGGPRPAVNMLWQWVGLGLGYLLARQLFCTAAEARAIVVVMLALCVVESAYGFWQLAVELPAARREFQETKAAGRPVFLAGQGIAMDAAMRHLAEARLSTPQPVGSFVLANSLAGLLAPWLVIGVAAAWRIARGRPIDWRVFGSLGLLLAATAVCLYLTESRTAMLAAAIGLVLVVATDGGGGLTRCGGWLLGAALVASIATTLLLALGNAPAIEAARQSLVVRWQYWQATLSLIEDYPLFGCGPGRFSDFYTRHMLPQASETISDPHNFLLEVWATAGTPALVALVAALGMILYRMWRSCEVSVDSSADAPSLGTTSRQGRHRPASPAPSDQSRGPSAIVYGAVGGWILSALLGRYLTPVVAVWYSWSVAGVGLLLGGAVVALLWPWVRTGRLTPRLFAIATAVLLVNLLSAGGISYPGVAGSLWLLAALGLNLAEPAADVRRLGRTGTLALFFALVALTALCERTARGPVMDSQTALDEAAIEIQSRQFARPEDYLLEAAAADPLSERAQLALAQLAFQRWLADPDARRFAEFQSRAARWQHLAAGSAGAAKLLGDFSLAAYRKQPTPAHLEAAIAAYRRAVDLYPNSNLYRAHLAWAEHLAGHHISASRQAAVALALEERCPHRERQLRGGLTRIADPARADASPIMLLQEVLDAAAAQPLPSKNRGKP